MKTTRIKNVVLLIAVLLIAVVSLSFIKRPNPEEKYVFIVGVADYQGVVNDLNYSDDDALAFYKRMRKLGVKKENIIILLDKNATQLNIIKKMSALFLKADENDQVIFFFSGHGAKGYFVPHDYNNLLSHKTVKLIFKQSKAKKKVCFADACYSGSIRKKIKNKQIKIDESYSLKQARNGGIAVMMSSTGDETSIESEQIQQGLFTFCLLDGLTGNADINKDNVVTITELFEYTKEAVSFLTNGKQNPILFGNFDINMPIIKKK